MQAKEKTMDLMRKFPMGESFRQSYLRSWVALDERLLVLLWSQSPDWSLLWIQHLGERIIFGLILLTYQYKTQNLDI